jgi:hypothetical protein
MSSSNNYSSNFIPSDPYAAPPGKYGALNNTICDNIVNPSKVASGPTLIKKNDGSMTYYSGNRHNAAYNPEKGWSSFIW